MYGSFNGKLDDDDDVGCSHDRNMSKQTKEEQREGREVLNRGTLSTYAFQFFLLL